MYTENRDVLIQENASYRGMAKKISLPEFPDRPIFDIRFYASGCMFFSERSRIGAEWVSAPLEI